MLNHEVTVVGAGLAGCEAAWQLARAGVNVVLKEMKPARYSDAHHSPNYAELVCSNSLRSNQLENGVGLLKEELRQLGSLIMECADKTQVPAGGALAVFDGALRADGDAAHALRAVAAPDRPAVLKADVSQRTDLFAAPAADAKAAPAAGAKKK